MAGVHIRDVLITRYMKELAARLVLRKNGAEAFLDLLRDDVFLLYRLRRNCT